MAQSPPLWAPWRLEYILGPKETGCIFCHHPRHGVSRERFVLFCGERAFVMLNRWPYINGHLLVVPRAHVPHLQELERADLYALSALLQASAAIVQAAFRPDGLNIGMNIGQVAGAGIKEHIHYHVVPRWSGDTNFMSAVGDARVIPQSLEGTFDELSTHFAALDPQAY